MPHTSHAQSTSVPFARRVLVPHIHTAHTPAHARPPPTLPRGAQGRTILSNLTTILGTQSKTPCRGTLVLEHLLASGLPVSAVRLQLGHVTGLLLVRELPARLDRSACHNHALIWGDARVARRAHVGRVDVTVVPETEWQQSGNKMGGRQLSGRGKPDRWQRGGGSE